MRLVLTYLFLLLCCFTATAQTTASVEGKISTNEEGTTESVAGMVVELAMLSDTLQKRHTITLSDGKFIFKQLSAGKYRLVASSLGYKNDTMTVTLKRGKHLTLPDWIVEMEHLNIDEVSITALAARSVIKGDTISYDAAAYNVLPDADADELLAKIPGMKVEDGKVTTQGEDVRKILVDGKEFFGENVSAALSSLPAEIIKSVEVFDKLSDEAELSGIDDGNSYKTINIVTHTKVRTSMTGRFNAGYSIEPRLYDNTQHYGDINSSLNIFRDKARTTLRLQLNNMNNNAQSRRGTAGINYVNSWGEKDRLKCEGSYTYNLNKSNTSRETDRDYFLSDKDYESNSGSIYEHYTSTSNSLSKSNGHNLNSRIEYRITPRQRFTLRVQLSLNDGSNGGNTLNNYFPINGDNPTSLTNWNLNESNSLSTSLNGSYIIRLGERAGRTINLNFGASYSTNGSFNESYSEKSKDNTVHQHATSDGGNYSYNGNISYAEPIGEHIQLTVNYSANYRFSDASKLTRLYDFENQMFLDEINARYSNVSNTSFLTQRTGPGFRFNNEKLTITGQLNYQHVTMSSDRLYPIEFSISNKRFENLTYSFTTRFRPDKQNLVSLRVSSNTSNPSINQLQDVVNISNINNIRAGNPYLKPSYSHQASLQYTRTNVERGRTFNFNVGCSKSNNMVVDSVVMNQNGYKVYDFNGEVVATLSAQGRFSKPVNIDRPWSVNGGANYAFPLEFIGCNFQIGANASLNKTPSILNGETNLSQEERYSASLRLNSTFSKNLDFRLQYTPTYSHITNSISKRRDNEFIRHQANGNVRVVLNCGLTMHVNARYSKYVGLSETSNRLNNSELICNLGVGMKLLRKRGELQLVVNDLFQQNKGFSHSTNVQYTQISTRDVIGRYYGVKFTYNYRNFGKRKSSAKRPNSKKS